MISTVDCSEFHRGLRSGKIHSVISTVDVVNFIKGLRSEKIEC